MEFGAAGFHGLFGGVGDEWDDYSQSQEKYCERRSQKADPREAESAPFENNRKMGSGSFC